MTAVRLDERPPAPYRAVPADQTLTAHLEIPVGTPLLRIRSTRRDKSQVPYDYYATWLRTDVVALEVDASMSA